MVCAPVEFAPGLSRGRGTFGLAGLALMEAYSGCWGLPSKHRAAHRVKSRIRLGPPPQVGSTRGQSAEAIYLNYSGLPAIAILPLRNCRGIQPCSFVSLGPLGCNCLQLGVS